MEFTTDLSALDWLPGVLIDKPRPSPLLLRHLLPDGFSGYYSLLPVVGIIPDFPFDLVKPEKTSIQQLNQNATIWTQYGVHTPGRKPVYQPTTFQALAARFRLPYTYRLFHDLPWRKAGFNTLSEQTQGQLASLLDELAPAVKLNLYVEDAVRWGPQVHEVLPTGEEVV
ncbi:hypothetical protein HER32_01965 [Hymenobacter sp. BT18]|uniref:hypothetical protein n=1 Tax=Hymenobacter sp. BT18 TaxID=2835648 RepID=UPI00143E7306|nr:hypothetical protein [Hymenobacter sp. BT18]QIX60020.1 hypothetical protein HER32_01965 [Hymenobacter sp. BT18]